MKEKKIRKIVREQIIGAIENDLECGESLMKEAFEQMETEEDSKICFDEMRQIIKMLKERP